MLTTHTYKIDWLFDFDNIDDLIDKLNEVKEKHRDADTVYVDCQWVSYEDVEYIIRYEVEETEQEKQTRIMLENERKLMKRKQEADAKRKREWQELIAKKEKELNDLRYDYQYRTQV